MQYLSRFNVFIEKWMPLVTPSCLFIGVIFAAWLGRFAPLVPWLFAFMTFAGSLSSGFRDMKKIAMHPISLIVVLLILHIVVPVTAFLVGSLIFDDPLLVTGIILEFIVPTGIVSLVWVNIYHGNSALTLSIILIDTLVAPFLVPFSLHVLMGSAVEISVAGMMKDLVLMIAVPALLAMALNHATRGRVKHTLSPKLAPFSKIGLILVVIINSTKVAPFFSQMTPALLLVTLVIFLLAVSGFFWGFLASKIFKEDNDGRVSMIFNSGMRNISAGAVIAGQYFPPKVMFPVMIGTLFQQILAAMAGFCLDRLASRERVVEKVS
ncbi:bile acid:sodium symporter family protein [Eubacterium callanderi]|uniref:bile acid:sodium symporter family protein n=1 Tax=Eubacterium callanderi TaxID=53442 RepID=UPI00391ABA72